MPDVEFWTWLTSEPARIADFARRAEAQGWDGVGSGDSQSRTSDPYVRLAFAAAVTDTLGLATSVTNPVTRHPSVTATAAFTIQRLSRGRMVIGIGRGDSALAHLGRAPARLKWFEAYLEQLQTYLSGGEVGFGVFDLCKLSMRFRPDFVVVGEILGQEADGLFQAAASGSGCMCSFHASSAEHALTRLEAPPILLSKSQTNLLTYILHMSWVLHDNKRQRKLISVTEIAPGGQDGGTVAGASCAAGTDTTFSNNPDTKMLNTLFWYDPEQNRVMPDSLDEIIEKSTVLPRMKVMLGVDDIRHDMERRMHILERIRDDNIAGVQEIHDEINTFYHAD